MKTVKKITLVSLLVVSLMTLSHYAQSQAPLGIQSNTSYITNIPYLSAGADAALCKSLKYETQGETSVSGTTYWLSLGDGTFANPFDLKTDYVPGPQDISNGQVTLRLHILPEEPGTVLLLDEVVVYYNRCLIDRKDEQ